MTTSGLGGSFTNPEQYGWAPPPSVMDPSKEAQKSKPQVGSSQNFILSSDINEVPLYIKAGHIGFYQASAGKPKLDISTLQIRQIERRETSFDDAVNKEYQNLIDHLPKNLQDKLKNSMDDPAVQAFDHSLHFDAQLIALCKSFSVPKGESTSAALFSLLPGSTLASTISFAQEIIQAFKNYATEEGVNSPFHDLLMGILNQTEEQVALLQRYQRG